MATNVAITKSVSSLIVTWNAPTSGLVETYEVKVEYNSGTLQTSTQTTRTVTFKDLEAGTRYAVVVVAISGNQRSEAVTKICYTSK